MDVEIVIASHFHGAEDAVGHTMEVACDTQAQVDASRDETRRYIDVDRPRRSASGSSARELSVGILTRYCWTVPAIHTALSIEE